MSDIYGVREYGCEVGDYQMVSEWNEGHTGKALAETLLPPVGVVVTQNGKGIAAGWMHLSAGIGVAFLENPVTKPGLDLKTARAALEWAMGALESVARSQGYSLLVANTLPGIGRVLERDQGFERSGERVQLTKRI